MYICFTPTASSFCTHSLCQLTLSGYTFPPSEYNLKSHPTGFNRGSQHMMVTFKDIMYITRLQRYMFLNPASGALIPRTNAGIWRTTTVCASDDVCLLYVLFKCLSTGCTLGRGLCYFILPHRAPSKPITFVDYIKHDSFVKLKVVIGRPIFLFTVLWLPFLFLFVQTHLYLISLPSHWSS